MSATATSTAPARAPMPQPLIDPWSRPFWDACGEGKLLLQRCNETGRMWHPPSPINPFHPKAGWEWVPSSGRGEVLSWVVFHQKYFAGFADRLPYNVSCIRLDEGVDILSNMMEPNGSIRIGRRVSLSFEQRGAVNVPVFVWAD